MFIVSNAWRFLSFSCFFFSFYLFFFSIPLRSIADELGAVKSSDLQNTKAILVHGSALDYKLSELPASVSVINHAQLQSNGAEHLQQQINFLPNLNFAGGSSRPRYFQIRGIGELEQYEGAPNNSVAVIVDGVDLTGTSAALALFDVEQLEVHRGPQPIRFGSSALAGAISLTTNDPSEELEGQATSSVGNDQLMAAGLAVGGPVSDSLGARVAVFGHRQNGFRDNTFLNRDDTNERKEINGRAKLLLKPSDSAQFKLTALNAEFDSGYDAFSIFNGYQTQTDRPGRDEESLKMLALSSQIDLSSTSNFESITSFYNSDNKYSFDGDWGNNVFWAPNDPYDYFSDSERERTAFAQELKLNNEWQLAGRKARSIFGVYYQNLNEDTLIEEFSDQIIYDELDSDYRADTYAAFTSLELPLSDDWTVVNGLRLEQRDSRYKDSKAAFFTPSDLMWGGNLTLQYQANKNSLWYSTLARGFRGGGFNPATGLPENRKSYDPESLVNYEVGNRFSLLKGSLNGSIAGFVNYRRDQQIKLAEQDDPSDPLSFTFITDNAAKGEGQGLELELGYKLNNKTSFNSSVGLLRTKIKDADPALAYLKGRDQSHAPRWNYLLESNYKFTDRFSGLVGVSGKEAFYFDDSHDQKSKAYHLLHAHLAYNLSDWQISVWGRNLTDEHYAIRGFYFGNEPPDFEEKRYIQLGDRRTFGVTINYFF